jgi:hypothetical protein
MEIVPPWKAIVKSGLGITQQVERFDGKSECLAFADYNAEPFCALRNSLLFFDQRAMSTV